jgi:hypothetical protein
VPDGVAYLAQTRHTTPARHDKTWTSPAHCSATEIVVPPFSGDHTHEKLVQEKTSFGRFSGERRRSPSRVRLKPPNTVGVQPPFPDLFVVCHLDLQEVSGES